MRSKSRTFTSSLMLLAAGPGLASVGQAQTTPDLTGYRDIKSALTTQIQAATPGARAARAPAYAGFIAAEDSRGRLIVEEVAPGSPADTAGIERGDRILQVEGRDPAGSAGLREAILARAPGSEFRLKLQSGKKPREVKLVLGATTNPLRLSERRPSLGVQIGGTEDTPGATVRFVTRGSAAEEAGIRQGDVISKIDGRELSSPAVFTDSLAERSPGETLTLTVQRDGREMEVKVRLAESQANPTVDPTERTPWNRDHYRLAVIPIEFPDTKHNAAIPLAAWEQALFSKGTYTGNSATGQPVFGSVNDYYLEQSSGQFRVEGKVFDWIAVTRGRAEYSEGSGTSRTSRTALFGEAVTALLARDGASALNGYDGIFFMYAGDRFRTTRGGIYWPHRSSFTHQGRRWPYFIVPEGGPRMTNISVICHEFGHMLGLPDLYARPENPGSEGLGTWCAMSNQAGNGRPQHMSAWCKERLGWLRPTVISPATRQKLLLAPIHGFREECYKVLVRPDGSEYLLLENRRKIGFDQSLPAEGLLIWRVVGDRPYLEESHGIEGPEGPRVFLTSVPYPSRANTAFTPYTVPSSRSLLGGGQPVHITGIRSLPDGRVAFLIGYEFQ